MKSYSTSEAQHGNSTSPSIKNTPRIVLLLTLALVLLTIIPLYFSSFSWTSSYPPPRQSVAAAAAAGEGDEELDNVIAQIRMGIRKQCDIFRGEWVPNPNAPYYTNDTCWAIHNHQNCMKYGRPDRDFLRWKWKPNDCDLPVFNPGQFLEMVRDKSLAFLGDSVGRNQMQSLICLLSRVTYAVDVSLTQDDKFKRYNFPTHNFTVASFWSPYLVRTLEADPEGPTLTGLFNLYLDEPDPAWTAEIRDFDYVIVSAGHWFFRPTMFYVADRLVGCHYCLKSNITDLTMYYSYRMAFRTTFKFFNSLEGSFKGKIFLRTYAPSHFENGEWNKGGDCVRRMPMRSNETRLEGINLEMYMTQLEEYRKAEEEGKGIMRRRMSFRLLDTTDATLLRPDGHPSKYGHLPKENVTVYNDCVHWCLPGPIDTWNDFLLHMLKMEGRRSAAFGRRFRVEQKI